MEGKLLYSTSTDLKVNPVYKVPSQQQRDLLVFDKTVGKLLPYEIFESRFTFKVVQQKTKVKSYSGPDSM